MFVRPGFMQIQEYRYGAGKVRTWKRARRPLGLLQEL